MGTQPLGMRVYQSGIGVSGYDTTGRVERTGLRTNADEEKETGRGERRPGVIEEVHGG